MAIAGLIFDFDGLILDTEGPIYQSWQELYQAYGCEISLDDWGKTIGSADVVFDPAVELERWVGQRLDWAELEPRRRRRETELILLEPPLPGVEDILTQARQIRLKVGLASSSPCGWVTGHLERLGLSGFFEQIVASDDVKRTKPDPQLFRLALTALGLAPEQAVVFEDSPNGVLAAKLAGIFTIAVPNQLTRQLSLALADMRLESLASVRLGELLKQVEKRKTAG